MVICIDYSEKGCWIAWDKERGVNSFPRLEVCGNPVRLQVVMQRKYPDAIIEISEAASMVALPMMDDYIDKYVGSSLHKHDRGQ
jgi:hypothetical protein